VRGLSQWPGGGREFVPENGNCRTLQGDQSGRRAFDSEENRKLVAFLKTLTGKQPQLVLPKLPPSSDETPRPVPFN
jgi:hypothetical protein